MYLARIHVLILLVLVVLLLVRLLTLDIDTVEVPLLDLTREVLQRGARLVLYHGLRDPEGLRLAALAAHCEFEVRHSLFGSLELNYRIYKMDATVDFDY